MATGESNALPENKNTGELDFRVLDALAKVTSTGDFRLGDFMKGLGMNPNQPVIYHRGLMKESRRFRAFIDFQDEIIGDQIKETAQLEARLAARENQIKALESQVSEGQRGIANLTQEKQAWEAAIAELQDK